MNHLAESSSPYLQLQATQPINWHPWGEAAFAEAQDRQVPVLVSIGYASCHWCHVMAEESFNDPEIAQYLNDNFVAIKVDRQEYPSVDAAFMAATQALTGQGGWPLNVFCTPAGQPFFAGTYFPAERRGNLPSFKEVCETMSQAWLERGAEVVTSANTIAAHVASFAELRTMGAPDIWPMMEELSADFDLLHGGFGTAPKFPPTTLIEALLVKGEPGCLDMAQRSCEAMARGGIYDQIGGGFHRYAVDSAWSVPHFEKMLSDNALLLGAFTRTWRRTADHDGPLRALIERVVAGTVGFLARELRLESGAFAAALDADSADIRGMAHEGIYYLWSPELLNDALGETDADWAINTFHVTEAGNFIEGLSTLNLSGRIDFERLNSVCDRLLAVRQGRFAPARDDAVVTAWNGWTIEALATAGMIFNEPQWLTWAVEAASYLWDKHWLDGELKRLSVSGIATKAPAIAEDYGALALGYARLAQALGQQIWADRAVLLLKSANELFSAEDGGFYDAAQNDELFNRPRLVTDSAQPSGTSVLIEALYQVGLLCDRPDFLARADEALTTTYEIMAKSPRHCGSALAQLLINDEARTGLGRATVVINDEPMSELVRAAWRMAPVGSVIIPKAGDSDFAKQFQGKEKGKAYICRGMTCFDPVDNLKDLRTQLWARC